MQLAVGIGHAHLVGIDQGEPTHAAACQRLGRPRADAADADHADVALRQLLDRTDTVKPLDAGEALVRKGKFTYGRSSGG